MIARLVAAAVVLALTAGCGVARSGANPTKPPTPTSVTTTSADLLPPRPRDLDLTGVDPCAQVLTDQQLRELSYDLGYRSAPIAGEDGISGGPSCMFASAHPIFENEIDRNLVTRVIVSTSEGAEAWLTDPLRSSAAELSRQTVVEGFPALVIPHPEFGDYCSVAVDTADGQYLLAAVTRYSGDDTTYDPYCAEARRVTAMGIRTLSASR